jgi:hypothetical protein
MKRTTSRTRVALAGAMALMTIGSGARADVSAVDSAAAQALFDQGRKLLGEGNFAQACPKLEESQRLDPGVGTLLNLADCYEKEGRIATAWSRFLEAAAAAKGAGQASREQAARSRAAALKPRIPSIVIDDPTFDSTPGLELRRDGLPLGGAQLGAPIPSDPGPHTITAKAPGRVPWETRVVLVEGGSTVKVSVPSLGVAEVASTPPPSAPQPVADAPRRGLGPQRIASIVAAGLGVVGLGLGAGFGLAAKSKNDSANEACPSVACSNENAVAESAAAIRDGHIATAAFIAGGIALGAGVVLWVTAKTPARTEARLGPGSIQIQGAW